MQQDSSSCESLASFGVLLQSDNQPYFKTPVCGAPFSYNRNVFENLIHIICLPYLSIEFGNITCISVKCIPGSNGRLSYIFITIIFHTSNFIEGNYLSILDVLGMPCHVRNRQILLMFVTSVTDVSSYPIATHKGNFKVLLLSRIHIKNVDTPLQINGLSQSIIQGILRMITNAYKSYTII